MSLGYLQILVLWLIIEAIVFLHVTVINEPLMLLIWTALVLRLIENHNYLEVLNNFLISVKN